MAADAVAIDVLVTWIGALGAASYLLHIVRNPSRSPLERRAVLLLGVLTVLLTVRGFAWMEPDVRLNRLTFAAATLLPLAMTLFVEGLLRRHLPRPAKLLAAGSSAFFFAMNLGPSSMRELLLFRVFAGVLVGMMALLGYFLLARRRDTLSPAENRLVSGCLLAVLASLPMAASDFRLELGFPPQRWGAVGVLLFVYTLVHLARLPEHVGWRLRELGWLALQALLLSGMGAFLSPRPMTVWAHALPLAAAVVLLFAIWERLRNAGTVQRQERLLRWLARAPAGSRDALVRWLRHYPLTQQHLLLGPEELRAYEAESLSALFGRSRTCSGAHFRQIGPGAPRRAQEAAEQMADILERYEMTHACLLSTHPLHLLLVNLPEMGGNRDAELELEVIQRHASLAVLAPPAHA
ncbi:MAG TPA: hypothetical protein VGX50_18750 [Longimicrobium sp.]|jgi:hypothetical protein|nr:hypothetical protein [Longimicrobium sp.]